MKTSTSSATFSCTPEGFWASFLDPAYLDELYLGELESQAFAILEIDDASRKLRIVPRLKLPAPVAKVIGEGFAYEEHGTLDRETHVWTWRMVQPTNLDSTRKARKDAVTMHGTVRLEVHGDGGCRRTDEFTVEAKLFGLGGLLESSIQNELQSARAKEYALLARWIERSGL